MLTHAHARATHVHDSLNRQNALLEEQVRRARSVDRGRLSTYNARRAARANRALVRASSGPPGRPPRESQRETRLKLSR